MPALKVEEEAEATVEEEEVTVVEDTRVAEEEVAVGIVEEEDMAEEDTVEEADMEVGDTKPLLVSRCSEDLVTFPPQSKFSRLCLSLLPEIDARLLALLVALHCVAFRDSLGFSLADF
ncbi:hypothetical protein NLI96_g7214 [Meripilus lineatus]|uniref:Uncharacterized protein n=1 Tax=Meripilus lineatus TaxID=2056292 RepID=A0AAD5V4T7_9APHY|nr:hypothetical protein NLI96_g7214 [Physisporinus lineatus]